MAQKTYSPFIELTRTDEVEGLSTISLINVDDITLVRCLDDGRAQVYFKPGYLGAPTNTPQFIIPVENYAWFIGALTELTQATAQPAPILQPAKRKRAARKAKAKK